MSTSCLACRVRVGSDSKMSTTLTKSAGSVLILSCTELNKYAARSLLPFLSLQAFSSASEVMTKLVNSLLARVVRQEQMATSSTSC